jgi:hypothetical protein
MSATSYLGSSEASVHALTPIVLEPLVGIMFCLLGIPLSEPCAATMQNDIIAVASLRNSARAFARLEAAKAR